MLRFGNRWTANTTASATIQERRQRAAAASHRKDYGRNTNTDMRVVPASADARIYCPPVCPPK